MALAVLAEVSLCGYVAAGHREFSRNPFRRLETRAARAPRGVEAGSGTNTPNVHAHAHAHDQNGISAPQVRIDATATAQGPPSDRLETVSLSLRIGKKVRVQVPTRDLFVRRCLQVFEEEPHVRLLGPEQRFELKVRFS